MTKMDDGVPCPGVATSGGLSWAEAEDTISDPADVCYTGTYATDVFVRRAREVRRVVVIVMCLFPCLLCG